MNLSSKVVLFSYLFLFPLGQITRFTISIAGFPVRVHPIDIVVGFSIPIYLFYKLRAHNSFVFLKNFLYIAGFSLLISSSQFPLKNLTIGLFYFLRLIAYFAFYLVIYNLLSSKSKKRTADVKDWLLGKVLLVIIISAILGWAQYFFVNDLRFLKYYGWDDHLGRLAGTFLDPGYAGLVFTFGAIISLWIYFRNNKKYLLGICILLITTLVFTYSRATYLAFIAGFVSLLIMEKKRKVILVLIGFLLLMLPFLPRPSSEGVKLERSFSIYARLSNYRETSYIFSKNPLFGVGYNNMCLARGKYFNELFFDSHSCSGADSSLLFIIASTGVVGIIVFIYAVYRIYKNVDKYYISLFIPILLTLATHSFFSNSFFYPWVLSSFLIISAISVKNDLHEV